MKEREQPINQNLPTVHGVFKNGSKEEILKMLQNQIDADSVDDNGDTLLHAMLFNKNLSKLDVIELLPHLLAQGVEPNIKNKLEMTALHFAIARGMKDAVDALLKSEADIHVANESGDTLAHLFIRFEYIKFRKIDETVKNLEIMENESLAFLEFLISVDLDFDRKNNRGRSALHLAMTYSLQHFFPTLIEHTKDINIADEYNGTLLDILLDNCTSTRRLRLFNGNPYSRYDSSFVVRCMETLFQRGAPFPIYDKYDKSVLWKAFEEKHEVVVIKTLIGHYLETCIDSYSATILLQELINTCTWWDSTDTDYFLAVISELAVKGADFNEQNQEGQRPVHAAIRAKEFRILKFLHENGAVLNVKTTHGKNLLHLLAEQKFSEESSRDYRSEVWYLITDGGCEMNVTCDRGDSPLRAAFACNNVAMALALINLGADIDCRDENSRTPLHEAVASAVQTSGGSSPEFIRFLLSNGADANVADFKGDTPLHLAAYNANLPIVRLLIEHGASVRSRDKHFLDTPLHRAVLIDNCETASEAELLSLVELLLASGADVNAEDRQGNTPLLIHCSVDNANASIVRSLLERGASVNCRDKYNMESPLHRAARKGRTAEIVELLLENGADANARDSEGKTPLQAHLATELVSETIARSLLRHGAFINVKDEHMETPLHRAVFDGTAPGIVELLLEGGADVNARNNGGNTPLHRLFKRWDEGSDRILELLLTYGACVNARNDGEQSVLFYVQSTRRMRSDDDDRQLNSLLSQHGLKLKAAKLPLSGEYKAYVDRSHDRRYYDECSAEIERLGSVLIDGSVSLYDFLRASPARRGAYVRSEKLQRLVESDEFIAQFPKYSVMILVGYREAARRKPLLGSAEQAFHRLTNVELPDCIDHVLGYLTSVDLTSIIEASKQSSCSIHNVNDDSKRRRLIL